MEDSLFWNQGGGLKSNTTLIGVLKDPFGHDDSFLAYFWCMEQHGKKFDRSFRCVRIGSDFKQILVFEHTFSSPNLIAEFVYDSETREPCIVIAHGCGQTIDDSMDQERFYCPYSGVRLQMIEITSNEVISNQPDLSSMELCNEWFILSLENKKYCKSRLFCDDDNDGSLWFLTHTGAKPCDVTHYRNNHCGHLTVQDMCKIQLHHPDFFLRVSKFDFQSLVYQVLHVDDTMLILDCRADCRAALKDLDLNTKVHTIVNSYAQVVGDMLVMVIYQNCEIGSIIWRNLNNGQEVTFVHKNVAHRGLIVQFFVHPTTFDVYFLDKHKCQVHRVTYHDQILRENEIAIEKIIYDCLSENLHRNLVTLCWQYLWTPICFESRATNINVDFQEDRIAFANKDFVVLK